MNNKDIPSHIAIILDGNGRWAQEKKLSRTKGHEQGALVVKDITKHCAKIGVKYLSLYAFSTENWKRPKIEVEFLMKLLQKYIDSQLDIYMEHNIKFKVIGDISRFSSSLKKAIENLENMTKNNTTMTHNLALNYGSKDEIVRALKKINEKNLEITEQNINNNLDTLGINDVDILIRTGKEKRISNFMLWQCAYAEMFFSDTYWPDFNNIELDKIILEFKCRIRRFGAI